MGGCKLDECNYITHGNYDAYANTFLGKKILEHVGLNPERLRIAFMSGADGLLLAQVTDEFTRKIKSLGPLGKSEGLTQKQLTLKLQAARKLVPYLKLVERERLRVPVKSKQAFKDFFESEKTSILFDQIFGDKMAISQIMVLLEEAPLSTGEISQVLGLSPSEISKHMKSSSRQGLVRYDDTQKRYALA